MAGEWTKKTFAELVGGRTSVIGGPFGSNLTQADYAAEGVPVIRGSNMEHHGRFIGGDFVRVSDDKAQQLSPSIVLPGDIVVTQRGTLGQVSIVPQEPASKYIVSQSQMGVRVEGSDSNFVYYLLRSPAFQTFIEGSTIQTGVPHINLGLLRDWVVVAPSRREQARIGDLLGALDDKIELNRRNAESLRVLAGSLFKSWFVDFDPVHVKAAGGSTGFSDDLDSLFPHSFDDRIPKGWSKGKLLEQARVISGGTPKTEVADYWGGDIAWASAADVSQCRDTFLIKTERTITERGLNESAARLIPKLATVVVARGATTGRSCIFGREMAMNQTCYALATVHDRPFWLNCLFESLVEALVQTGHGSVFNTITTKTLDAAQIVVPESGVIDRFEAIIRPIFGRILCGIEEAATLAALRDTLLPKLILGELRVSDAEKRIVAA